jgi:hypothetical protein
MDHDDKVIVRFRDTTTATDNDDRSRSDDDTQSEQDDDDAAIIQSIDIDWNSTIPICSTWDLLPS